MSEPRVAAIVLNYNGRDVTLEALASLGRMDYPACDLVVVDNGSTDGSFQAIAEAFPDVVQIRTEENLGPAGGCNLGMRWAAARGYDYLLVLNNDIEVAPSLLAEMVRVAEGSPEIGLVGPMGYYYWDRQRIWSAGGRIVFREAVTKERGQGELDRGQYDRDEELDYVNGCAMLVKRRVIEAVGLWDPIFHLSVEDADFCMRARAAGFRCWFAHRAKLWHMVSTSTGGYRAPKTYQTARSTAIFVRRYADPRRRLASFAWSAAALGAAFVRELARGNQAAVLAKVRGFADGYLRTPMTEPPRLGEPAPAAAEEVARAR